MATREPLVPIEEILKCTGLTRQGFYSLRHRGEGPPAYRIGQRLMFDWADVEAWIESRREDRPAAA